jgi:hypothetical protein
MSSINIKVTPNEIKSLKFNEVFVFGSNTKGIHGKGAALVAKQKFGATEGRAFGHSGQSFAIPTKDGVTFAKRSVSLTDIKKYIKTFLDYAIVHPNLEFLVTRIGCGLSGYADFEIANLFKDLTIPGNVSLPASFIAFFIEKEETLMSEFKMVQTGKNSRLTLVNLYNFLKENPITYKEALFLGWVSKETGFTKSKREEVKKLSTIIYKLDVDDAELALDRKISPYRMVAGLNYINYLKSTKGSILPPDFEEALVNKTLKITTESNKLAKYIACWYPGYSPDSEVDPSELEESSAPCLCEDKSLLPQSYEGKVYHSQIFADWWALPSDAPFYNMLIACSTGWDKEKSAFQLNNHTWVNWNSEESIVTLVNKQRISRSIYTVRGVEDFFVEDPMMLWGNFLIQFAMNGGSEDYLSLLINRDCTDLLTPSVVYGDISPLNHAVNHDTVGHLKVQFNKPSDDGCTVGFDFRNDKEAYTAAEAADIAMQRGMPVLFQHQLEKVRIGKGAQALGKSTIKVYVKLDKDTFLEGSQYSAGSLVPVDLILGQDEVDKAAKLFNRDALCVRVTPGVKVIFPEGFATNEHLANELESFAASLLA